MRKSMAIGTTAVLLAVGATTLGAGCAECDCVPNAVTLTVPAGCGAKVSAVTATGSACTLAETTRGEDSFHVHPKQQGTCDIRIYFEDGWSYEFSATIYLLEDDCCGGLYPVEEHRSSFVPYPGTCG